LGVHFSAAIFKKKLVEISGKFLQYFLAHMYSGKVTKAIVIILNGFGATG